jgi:hypothetical protein
MTLVTKWPVREGGSRDVLGRISSLVLWSGIAAVWYTPGGRKYTFKEFSLLQNRWFKPTSINS